MGIDIEPESSGHAELEALIAMAGRYVVPTDDLRPRVLEAAHERYLQRKTVGKLACAMIAATLCVMTGVSLSNRLQANADSTSMPRGERLERMVTEREAESRQGPHWALAEIITDWKGKLATRLPGADSDHRPALTSRAADASRSVGTILKKD